MKLIVIGAGPSGLYFALISKKRFPDADITVYYEQNPKGTTYGFGIVLADRRLERFRAADEASYEAIVGSSFVTRHREILHCGDSVFIEGGGYGGAIARLRLLTILDDLCIRSGIEIRYGTRVAAVQDIDDADLVVGADGVNSALRQMYESEFGTTRWTLTNRLAWYGTTCHYPRPILSFKRHRLGHFVAAAYPYTEKMSTFVAECDAQTWETSGFSSMTDEERQQLTEEIFADELAGHTLQSNRSTWHALRSAHPTIGSGTRIAMEDAIALVEALAAHPADIGTALSAFRATREPQKQKLVRAAERRFMWYEAFAQKVDSLDPIDFTFDFLTRMGRITEQRLRSEYPEFLQRYGHRWPARHPVIAEQT